MSKKLNKREKKFCKLYLKTRNIMQTKLQLGYEIDISKKKYREYIQTTPITLDFEIPVDPLLRTLYAIATFDPLSMYDKDGDVKPLKCLTDEQRMALKTYTEHKNGTIFTVHNKQQALEALMKHKGLYEKDNDQKKPVIAAQLNFNDLYNKDK